MQPATAPRGTKRAVDYMLEGNSVRENRHLARFARAPYLQTILDNPACDGMLRRQGKARVRDVFDPDYSLDDHFGRTKKGGSGGGGQELKVGYGKRANPNDVRSRPKKL